MNERREEPEPEPLVVEITVDATRAVRALEKLHTEMVFATHPDLDGWLRSDEPLA